MSVRAELGLTPVQPLDPRALAEWVGVPVEPISCLTGDGLAAFVDHFRSDGQTMFSAVTIFPDYPSHRRVILYNDANPRARQNSDIAHELSHGLLLHEPRHAIVNGCRDYNRDEEEEANWLAGCLLIPRQAAVRLAQSRAPKAQLVAEFGVSEKMYDWRLDVTGARIQVRRARQRRNTR
jgi:Zn-dependent peptidase ImmA (M78 family)